MKSSLFFAFFLGLFLCSCTQNENKKQYFENQVVVIDTPERAVEVLRAGNTRFTADESQHPNLDLQRLKETSTAQHPFATIIGCSDSRVPIELIFDQGVGDLFVIRTAGNSVNDDLVMGSLDYSIDHLGVKLVVVLGHQCCGGISGAINTAHEGEHHCGKVGELINTLREDVGQYVGHRDSLDKAIRLNINKQIERITNVDYIARLIEQGKLKVIGAQYRVESGEVLFYE